MAIIVERVQLFIDALHSGEYKQGRGYLEWADEDGITHCCLGVACRVAMANGLKLYARTDVYGGATHFDGEATTLPAKVVAWYGFDSQNPEFAEVYVVTDYNSDESRVDATYANDTLRWDFHKIADAFKKMIDSTNENTE